MGKSDNYLIPFYKRNVDQKGRTALLGFTDNRMFEGDLYDLQLNNWDINADWSLNGKYDTIISLRCPCFSKDPRQFIEKCHSHLNEGGRLFVDWGLGDHWRFANYKVGWCKGDEQEYAYENDNYLWSFVWSDEFLDDPEFKKFSKNVARHGYTDLKKSVVEEVPEVLGINDISQYFDVSFSTLSLWDDMPQFYVLLKCFKK